MISRRPVCRHALKNQKIEFRRLADKAGQYGVYLTPVGSLVIEPMRKGRSQLLLEQFRRGNTAIFDCSSEARVVKAVDKIDDPGVLRLARGTQLIERVEQDRIQPVRRIALAGKPLHPDPICCKEVVEGAVDGLEEGATVGAVLLGRESRHGRIKSAIGPPIVVSKHTVVS